MRKISRLTVVAWAGLLVGLAGCTEVPITGRTQLNFVPTSLVNSLSLKEYDQFISQNKVITGTPEAEMVKRVGQRIVQVVDNYCQTRCRQNPFVGYNWEFNLVEDKAINAFALPGGKVVVYTGIMPIAQTEAGLATVISHEIAHVFAGHGGERLSQSLLTQMGQIGLAAALQQQPEQTRSLFLSAYGLGSQVGVLLPFDRLQETEADHLGLIFMAMAGYDPQAGVAFWERMMEASKGQARPPEFLSTHPADATRIQQLQKFLPEAMPYYRAAQEQGPILPGRQSQTPAPSIFPPDIR